MLTNSKCQHPFSKRFLARAKKKTYLGKRDTLPFLTLPSEILITCISVELRLFFYFTGNGIQHLKSIWKYVTFNPIRCFSFLRQGVSRLQNRVVTRTGTSDELSQFIENSNWRASPKCLSLKSFAKPHEIPRFGWLKQLRAFVEISLAIVRVLNDISSQLNWGTSDSRKGCVLQNAMRNVFECLISIEVVNVVNYIKFIFVSRLVAKSRQWGFSSNAIRTITISSVSTFFTDVQAQQMAYFGEVVSN